MSWIWTVVASALLASNGHASELSGSQTQLPPQTQPPPPSTAPVPDDSAAQRGIAEVVRKRKEQAADPHFDPMEQEDAEHAAIDAAHKAWNDGKADQSLDILWKLLKAYPTSIAGVRNLAEASEAWAGQAKDPEHKELFAKTAKALRARQAALIQSILDSGDGKTDKTAWVALDVAEEYEVLRWLKLKHESQALMNGKDGKAFDVFDVSDEKGQRSKLYFDTTIFFNAENRLLSH